MELLINKDLYEISIPLLIKNFDRFFNCKNFVRGCHVYVKAWSPFLGECLLGKKEPSNGVDKNAVAVIRLHSCGREEVVGHVPQNISKVVSLYLSLPHFYLELVFTGKHVNRESRFYGPEKASQWLDTRITKTEEQLKIVNYYLK